MIRCGAAAVSWRAAGPGGCFVITPPGAHVDQFHPQAVGSPVAAEEAALQQRPTAATASGVRPGTWLEEPPY